ncbi:MAG: hypothetical protein ABH837_01400 [bacterium]
MCVTIPISKSYFDYYLKEELGDHYGRGLKIFEGFEKSERFQGDVVLLLLATVTRKPEKIEEVLEILEKHLESYPLHQIHRFLGGAEEAREMFRQTFQDISYPALTNQSS